MHCTGLYCRCVQVLSKELLSAVQLVEAEIIQSEDALPSATIKFFLKAGRSMGTDWVRYSAVGSMCCTAAGCKQHVLHCRVPGSVLFSALL